MVDPSEEVMRKKTVGFGGFRPCHDDYGAGGVAPAGRAAPDAAIFTRGAREKISTSKVLQTAIALRDERVAAVQTRKDRAFLRPQLQGVVPRAPRPSGRAYTRLAALAPFHRPENGKRQSAHCDERAASRLQKPSVAPQGAAHPQRHPPLREHRPSRARTHALSATPGHSGTRWQRTAL